jgi:hypothetical protein
MFGSIYAKVAAVMIVVSATECFGLSLIRNGSFEADGPIADIKAVSPQFWDVNAPANFGGRVSTYWRPDNLYALTIFSGAGQTYTAGEQAFLSQQVDLSDVNQIIFDVKLLGNKYGEIAWDPTKCTAFVKIDSNDVWTSGPTATGAYYDVIVDVNSYKDSQPHKLSFGMRVDVSANLSPSYWAVWDSLKFDTYCGGGYLSGDFNYDCYVDMADVQWMASEWLDANMPAGSHRADMAPDGTINLADFAIFAEQWMDCTDWTNGACESLEPYLGYDLNGDGIVNFADYAAMMAGEAEMTDIGYLADQWLQKTWVYDFLNTSEGGGSPL